MTLIITPEYLAKSGTEDAEQTALFCWAAMAQQCGFRVADDMTSYAQPFEWRLQWEFRAISCLRWLHAVPNGGGRSKSQAGRLKGAGVKAGVADIELPVCSGRYTGLHIEMKRIGFRPSDVSKEQNLFLAFVREQGRYGAVCGGWLEASKLIKNYLLGDRRHL